MPITTGLTKMPEVGVYQSPEVNAFATGPSRNNSLVAVSSGLLQQMTTDEVEGVLAHEIAHVANGDMVTMALVQGVVNAFVMFFARIAAFALQNVLSRRWPRRRCDRQDPATSSERLLRNDPPRYTSLADDWSTFCRRLYHRPRASRIGAMAPWFTKSSWTASRPAATGWQCDDPAAEADTVIKTGGGIGGVLCCRD